MLFLVFSYFYMFLYFVYCFLCFFHFVSFSQFCKGIAEYPAGYLRKTVVPWVFCLFFGSFHYISSILCMFAYLVCHNLLSFISCQFIMHSHDLLFGIFSRLHYDPSWLDSLLKDRINPARGATWNLSGRRFPSTVGGFVSHAWGVPIHVKTKHFLNSLKNLLAFRYLE